MTTMATSIYDFNETDFKLFATRSGDRWTFTIPAEELQNMDSLIPDYVLTVKNEIFAPGGESMYGKLMKKKEK
jgi:hypothetical protein